MTAHDPSIFAGDLYGDAIDRADCVAPVRKRDLLPGFSLCAAAALAATWLSERYGPPLILMGLLLGLSLNFAATAKTHPGLDLISKTGLRWGIVLLGLQVTLGQIAELGLVPFAALLVVMVAATAAALVTARWLGLGGAAGILAGGATAICGASAALALYAVIGRARLGQAQFAITLVAISLASAFAMLSYPPLAEWLQLSDRQAGFVIGGSIHDVAQAIGGGYAVSDDAGRHATIVKLARIALLAPYVLIVSLVIQEAGPRRPATRTSWLAAARRVGIPWFVLGFFAVVCVNSALSAPAGLGEAALASSKTLLLAAVTATAMRSQPSMMRKLGWRAAMPVVAASAASLASAVVFALVALD